MDAGWWQEVLQTLSSLGWWKIAIVVILAFLVGTLGAAGLVYWISRSFLKDRIRYLEVFSLFANTLKRGESSVLQSDGIAAAIPEVTSGPLPEISNSKGTLIPASLVESKPMPGDVIAELDHNLARIHSYDGKQLLPLQVRAWQSYLSLNNKLTTDLEFQLEQIYYDLGLWNNVVWMSSELLNRTDFSNRQYKEILLNIEQRIQSIRNSIK
jgi:hypothetical protein